MITSTPTGDELVKIVDFGIARVINGESKGLSQGMSIGSPHFMSPEQAMAKYVDARSDVYSTGATLFFAVSGRPPYHGGALEVRQQLLNMDVEAPPPPGPLADHPIAPVLQRALAKSRTARPQSAAELGRMLRTAGGAWAPPCSGSGRGVVVP
jgi:serine/threonine-protein kinase